MEKTQYYHQQLLDSVRGLTYEDASTTAEFLQAKTVHRPKIAIICGSGLGPLGDTIKDTNSFDFKEIPNFPVSTVSGHKGRLIFGKLGDVTVVCMQGRVHAYEGYPQWRITFPVRVMKLLGVTTLIVSNAAGSLNEKYNIGDIMLLKDHINLPGLCGLGPLVGPNDERFGPRFPAMSNCYNRKLREVALGKAKALGMDYMQEGVYVVQTGPCYETVAECLMLKNMGADVTGMSTVPEVAIAHHCGIKCLAFSLVTNKCITEFDSTSSANHEEVLAIGQQRSKDLIRLIQEVIIEIDQDNNLSV